MFHRSRSVKLRYYTPKRAVAFASFFGTSDPTNDLNVSYNGSHEFDDTLPSLPAPRQAPLQIKCGDNKDSVSESALNRLWSFMSRTRMNRGYRSKFASKNSPWLVSHEGDREDGDVMTFDDEAVLTNTWLHRCRHEVDLTFLDDTWFGGRMEIRFDLKDTPDPNVNYFVNFHGCSARVVLNEEDVVRTEGVKTWSGDRIYLPHQALKRRKNKLTIFFLNSFEKVREYSRSKSLRWGRRILTDPQGRSYLKLKIQHGETTTSKCDIKTILNIMCPSFPAAEKLPQWRMELSSIGGPSHVVRDGADVLLGHPLEKNITMEVGAVACHKVDVPNPSTAQGHEFVLRVPLESTALEKVVKPIGDPMVSPRAITDLLGHNDLISAFDRVIYIEGSDHEVLDMPSKHQMSEGSVDASDDQLDEAPLNSQFAQVTTFEGGSDEDVSEKAFKLEMSEGSVDASDDHPVEAPLNSQFAQVTTFEGGSEEKHSEKPFKLDMSEASVSTEAESLSEGVVDGCMSQVAGVSASASHLDEADTGSSPKNPSPLTPFAGEVLPLASIDDEIGSNSAGLDDDEIMASRSRPSHETAVADVDSPVGGKVIGDGTPVNEGEMFQNAVSPHHNPVAPDVLGQLVLCPHGSFCCPNPLRGPISMTVNQFDRLLE